MKCFANLLFLAMVTAASAHGHRLGRASSGAYTGVRNGEFFGGTYDDSGHGPPIINRFGNPGAFAGPGFAYVPGAYAGPNGAFAGAGSGAGAGASAGGGAFAGSSAFAGPGGAFAGPGTYAPQFPFGGNFHGFQSPFNFFPQFFDDYFKTLNKNLAAAEKHKESSSSSSSSTTGDSSDDGVFAKNSENQQAAYNAAQNAFQSTAHNQFGGAPSFHHHPGFVGAAASASAGPHGGHQSAHIYPENPSNPNLNVRFGSGETKPGGNVFGVATSSFASSSNIDGKKSTHRQSTTTINDNGKIKTYTVKS